MSDDLLYPGNGVCCGLKTERRKERRLRKEKERHSSVPFSIPRPESSVKVEDRSVVEYRTVGESLSGTTLDGLGNNTSYPPRMYRIGDNKSRGE